LCRNNIQPQWTGDRVVFIKGWTEFDRKSQMVIDDTIVFTPMDGGFNF
jgi:hypothetical protein